MSIRALQANKVGDAVQTAVVEISEAELGAGDVVVRIEWSTINYKDGLALSGLPRIIQSYPLIPGIDFAGVVESSDNPAFKPGDRVAANSWGLSMTHNGGYAQKARVPAEWLIPLPDALSTRQAMAIGTAGYTAMLCVMALERGGVSPQNGPILVTGANGGVGSVAIALLSRLGYQVTASTGRLQEGDYLKSLGAADIIDRASLSEPGKPLQSEQWAGVVDSVGSHTLANAIAQTRYGGVVTACGLAQGMDLATTVAPFIMRSVTLAGIDSVNAPQALRLEAWSRLAKDLDQTKLEATISEVGLADVPKTAQSLLKGQVRGRTLVDVNR